MPIYEYQCERCQHALEAMQKLSEPPLEKCPACQYPELRKLVSAAAFKLTGTGWYVTDFKHDKKPGSDAGDKAKGDPSNKQTESKKDDGDATQSTRQSSTADNKKKETVTADRE